MQRPRLAALIAMILAAAATRLAPHPWNLTSIGAIALFGGATFQDRRLAVAVPLLALFLSDLVLGLYADMPVVYGSFLLVAGIGVWLRSHRNPATIAGAALASSIVFFVLTNLGVWAFGHLYPTTWAGLGACFTAAVPFLRNTVEGDLIYTAALFGGLALLERCFAPLRDAPAGADLALA